MSFCKLLAILALSVSRIKSPSSAVARQTLLAVNEVEHYNAAVLVLAGMFMLAVKRETNASLDATCAAPATVTKIDTPE